MILYKKNLMINISNIIPNVHVLYKIGDKNTILVLREFFNVLIFYTFKFNNNIV